MDFRSLRVAWWFFLKDIYFVVDFHSVTLKIVNPGKNQFCRFLGRQERSQNQTNEENVIKGS